MTYSRHVAIDGYKSERDSMFVWKYIALIKIKASATADFISDGNTLAF
jgi:hypothetical protein